MALVAISPAQEFQAINFEPWNKLTLICGERTQLWFVEKERNFDRGKCREFCARPFLQLFFLQCGHSCNWDYDGAKTNVARLLMSSPTFLQNILLCKITQIFYLNVPSWGGLLLHLFQIVSARVWVAEAQPEHWQHCRISWGWAGPYCRCCQFWMAMMMMMIMRMIIMMLSFKFLPSCLSQLDQASPEVWCRGAARLGFQCNRRPATAAQCWIVKILVRLQFCRTFSVKILHRVCVVQKSIWI